MRCPRSRWVAAVEFVLVVEAYGNLVRYGWRWRPFENFLSPVHAQVVVHPAGVDHLHLSGVPERVVSLGVFELPL